MQRIQQKTFLYLVEIYQLHSSMTFNICNRAASLRLRCIDYLLEYASNGPGSSDKWWYLIVFVFCLFVFFFPVNFISVISENWQWLWRYSVQRIQQKALLYLMEIYQLHSSMTFNICNRAASLRLRCLDYLLEYASNGPDCSD